jgi:hypothetical protein
MSKVSGKQPLPTLMAIAGSDASSGLTSQPIPSVLGDELDRMVWVTSTRCTAVFPALDLRLPAGVPTPIPASAADQVQTIPGVVVVEGTPSPLSPEEI